MFGIGEQAGLSKNPFIGKMTAGMWLASARSGVTESDGEQGRLFPFIFSVITPTLPALTAAAVVFLLPSPVQH